MKTNITFLLLLLFVAVVSCQKSDNSPQGSGQPPDKSAIAPPVVHQSFQVISVSDAQNNLTAWFNTKPESVVVNAFLINSDELDAMISLRQNVAGAVKFRIYMGTNQFSVWPVNRAGGDISDLIYGVSSVGSGPCPLVCDYSSPIFNNPKYLEAAKAE